MSSTFCGSVFAGLTAFFLGALGCSDAAPQKEANSAETRSQAGFMLAGVAPPERSEERQPQEGEPDRVKADGEAVEIPLDQIWAWNMPGTCDLQELEPEQHLENLKSLSPAEQRRVIDKQLWIPIANSLTVEAPGWPREGQIAKPGFAVVGTGIDALRRAHAVFAEGKKPRDTFAPESAITIVFFSYQFGTYVHLQQVELRENIIDVEYRFVPHGEIYLTAHFALIPLGKLPIGKYQVRIIQAPPVQESRVGGHEALKLNRRNRTLEKESGLRFVCGSFAFSVVDGASE